MVFLGELSSGFNDFAYTKQVAIKRLSKHEQFARLVVRHRASMSDGIRLDNNLSLGDFSDYYSVFRHGRFPKYISQRTAQPILRLYRWYQRYASINSFDGNYLYCIFCGFRLICFAQLGELTSFNDRLYPRSAPNCLLRDD